MRKASAEIILFSLIAIMFSLAMYFSIEQEKERNTKILNGEPLICSSNNLGYLVDDYRQISEELLTTRQI